MSTDVVFPAPETPAIPVDFPTEIFMSAFVKTLSSILG